MHRWTDLAQVPPGFGPSVVTLGNFDGVHRGHHSVLTRMVADARAVGARAVAVTFSPHPAQVHHPDTAPPLLTGVADRLLLLEQTGLDAVLLLEYSLDFARQSPEAFVTRYLVHGLGARAVVVGRDVRFGWANAGDLTTMTELGAKYGFVVDVIEDLATEPEPDAPAERTAHEERLLRAADPLHRRWSSTWVRELLLDGRVADAANILGRPHRVRGVVVHGDARGRELGYPTANLSTDAAGMIPEDGVYAGWLRRLERPVGTGDVAFPAAISVGTNPTFDGVQRRVEAYVLDRTDLDLYGEEVAFEFVARLRSTLRFDSVDDLIATMRTDVDRARALLTAAGGPPTDW